MSLLFRSGLVCFSLGVVACAGDDGDSGDDAADDGSGTGAADDDDGAGTAADDVADDDDADETAASDGAPECTVFDNAAEGCSAVGGCEAGPTNLEGTLGVGEACSTGTECEPVLCGCSEGGEQQWYAASCACDACATMEVTCLQTEGFAGC